jgi:transcriptional regulator with XRE-family HTH domain
MDFTIIKAAGLHQEHFAGLVGVSRVTVNTWVKGHYAPKAALRFRVRNALRALNTAIERGVLPVQETNKEEEIQRRLKELEADVNQGA